MKRETTGSSISRVVFAVIGGIGLVAVIALAYHWRSSIVSHGPEGSAPVEGRSQDQKDSEESVNDGPTSLGTLLGVNKPAPPPIVFQVGPAPGEADAPDLSTPASAVYSVLTLIDQGTSDRLDACFVNAPQDTATLLYPRCLGSPIELVEVIEDGDSAEVIWKATVHTAFSQGGRSRSPGETVTLKTKLVRVEELWKLLKLHEGVNDAPQ